MLRAGTVAMILALALTGTFQPVAKERDSRMNLRSGI
jgi:hypothetical protein